MRCVLAYIKVTEKNIDHRLYCASTVHIMSVLLSWCIRFVYSTFRGAGAWIGPEEKLTAHNPNIVCACLSVLVFAHRAWGAEGKWVKVSEFSFGSIKRINRKRKACMIHTACLCGFLSMVNLKWITGLGERGEWWFVTQDLLFMHFDYPQGWPSERLRGKNHMAKKAERPLSQRVSC